MVDDNFMREMLGKTKPYCVVILHGTDKLSAPEAAPIVWEHARRNFQLRADGLRLFTYDIHQSRSFPGDAL